MIYRWLKHWCYVLGILAAKVYHGFCPGRDHLLQYGETLDKTAPLALIVEGFESMTDVVGPRTEGDLEGRRKDLAFANQMESRKYETIHIEFVLPEGQYFDGEVAPHQHLETLQ